MVPPPKPVLKATGLFEDDGEEAIDMFADVAPTEPVRKVNLPNLKALVDSQTPRDTQPEDKSEKPWVRPGLLLKCLNSQLASGRYAQRRGIVQKVVEEGWGVELRMIDSLDVLLLDQEECSPTLPIKAGDPVLVIRGQYAGSKAGFQEISADGKDAVIELGEGPRRRLVSVPLASVCTFIQ